MIIGSQGYEKLADVAMVRPNTHAGGFNIKSGYSKFSFIFIKTHYIHVITA